MKCPKCNSNLKVETLTKFDPAFGYTLFITYKCDNCGYTDTIEIPLNFGKKKKIEIDVNNKEDLNKIIARSRYAKIEIPELGIEIIPSIDAKDQITTIEGILNKIEEILSTIEDSEKKKEIINKIKLAKEGKLKFKLIIEDPYGLSKIIS